MLTLQELKDKLEAIEGVQFKQFNSITDYHSLMFDLGIVARRLRSASDRSKFYRLIEASLYGGISSAITRSLRDYLLPENSGVRKSVPGHGSRAARKPHDAGSDSRHPV